MKTTELRTALKARFPNHPVTVAKGMVKVETGSRYVDEYVNDLRGFLNDLQIPAKVYAADLGKKVYGVTTCCYYAVAELGV